MKALFFILGITSTAACGFVLYVNSAMSGNDLLFAASQESCLAAAKSFVNDPIIGGAYINPIDKADYLKSHSNLTANQIKYADNRYDRGEPYQKILVQAGLGSTNLICEYIIVLPDQADIESISTPKKYYAGTNSILFEIENTVHKGFRDNIDVDDISFIEKTKLLFSY